MRPTDTSQLTAPLALRKFAAAEGTEFDTLVANHTIPINLRWWRRALADRGLDEDLIVHDSISRGDLFALGLDTSSSAATERLLWNTVAWGLGTRTRLAARRLDSVLTDRAQSLELLRVAGLEARRDPLAGYTLLRPAQRNAIRYLGPAFFTKFLYFAGGGDPHHRSLILDSRVAATLRTHGWDSLRAGGNWPAATYARYADLIARWGSELGCRGDVIEMWLFDPRIADAADRLEPPGQVR